jgi:hypothetical protein
MCYSMFPYSFISQPIHMVDILLFYVLQYIFLIHSLVSLSIWLAYFCFMCNSMLPYSFISQPIYMVDILLFPVLQYVSLFIRQSAYPYGWYTFVSCATVCFLIQFNSFISQPIYLNGWHTFVSYATVCFLIHSSVSLSIWLIYFCFMCYSTFPYSFISQPIHMVDILLFPVLQYVSLFTRQFAYQYSLLAWLPIPLSEEDQKGDINLTAAE